MGSYVSPDGNLHFANILPGRYVFRLDRKLPGMVLQSVRCNGAEVTTGTPLRDGDRQQGDGLRGDAEQGGQLILTGRHPRSKQSVLFSVYRNDNLSHPNDARFG